MISVNLFISPLAVVKIAQSLSRWFIGLPIHTRVTFPKPFLCENWYNQPLSTIWIVLATFKRNSNTFQWLSFLFEGLNKFSVDKYPCFSRRLPNFVLNVQWQTQQFSNAISHNTFSVSEKFTWVYLPCWHFLSCLTPPSPSPPPPAVFRSFHFCTPLALSERKRLLRRLPTSPHLSVFKNKDANLRRSEIWRFFLFRQPPIINPSPPLPHTKKTTPLSQKSPRPTNIIITV